MGLLTIFRTAFRGTGHLLFCPTKTAIEHLRREGISHGVHQVGDVMYDSVLYHARLAEKRSQILSELKLKPKRYALATVHRAENTDDPERLQSIFHGLEMVAKALPIVVPLHPRTRKQLSSRSILLERLQLTEPVSYLDMLLLEKNARLILTDSGGVQKEACFLETPCLTLRDGTKWIETVEAGWNLLVGIRSRGPKRTTPVSLTALTCYDILILQGGFSWA